jgi:ribosome-associated translation inhibitor RaiA
MPLNLVFELGKVALSAAEEDRVRHQLQTLERRLAHFPNPTAELALEAHPAQRRMEVKLRVRLGPLGGHLISQQAAETVDRAVHLAVEDLERQLERRLAQQRGEPSYGVPSRRLPKTLRPHPPAQAETP